MRVPFLTPAALIILLHAVAHTLAQQKPVDSSFQADVSGSVNSVLVQSDGKLIVGGEFTAINGQSALNLARLDANGALDNTFILDGNCSKSIQSMVMSGGGIICEGMIAGTDGKAFGPLFRLNSNGTINQNFQIPSGIDIGKIAVQNDGKIVFSFQNSPYIGRLNLDGSVDTTFQAALSGSSALEAGVDSLAVQIDGKILVGGTFNTDTGPQNLVRLNQNGSLDLTYSNNPGLLLYVYDIFVQQNGQAILSGKTSPNYGARPLFRRLDQDRGIDVTFLDGSQPVAVAAQWGETLYTKGAQLLRLNLDGSVDDSFSIALGGGMISTVAIQPDGRVIAAGRFSTVNGEVHNNIVRFQAVTSANPVSPQKLSFSQPCNNVDHFCTTLLGVSGQRYVIEASGDLSTWTEMTTETATDAGVSISFDKADLPNPFFLRAKLAVN